MKVKIFTDSLKLATISFLGIITLSPQAKAASIKFGEWTLDKDTVTASSSYAGGKGSATPNTLKAIAAVSATLNPGSWGREHVTTKVSLSNFFTVEAGEDENVGDTVKGRLFGNLGGSLSGSGVGPVLGVLIGGSLGPLGALLGGIITTNGDHKTTVIANVNAGFQSFSYSDSNSGSVFFVDADTKPVNIPFNKAGLLTIGEQYPFNMDLTVSASKYGIYQAFSKFDNTFTADVEVEAVPEPITIMGSGLALGFGALFKTKYSRKQKKAKSLEKQKV
jgi:hypothetical protein